MLRKLFLNLVLLTGVCATPLCGIDRGMCCSNGLGSGFLIGGYATFHLFEFHTKDDAFNSATKKDFWRYDSFQQASGGGGFIGYGIPLCERFNLAFKAAVTGFTSDAGYSYYDDSPSNNYTNKMEVKHIIDLSLEPGAKIGNCVVLYVKCGASNVGFRQARQILDEDVPNPVFGKDKLHDHKWGYVLGSGANVIITECISAFAEYDWHSFSLKSTRRVANTDESVEPLDYRLTRLYGHGFKLGLMARF